MIDTKDLGKIKYIYKVYISKDDKLYIEKYPIIYINSKVVYFKTGRKQYYLDYCQLLSVYNNFTDLSNNILSSSYPTKRNFYSNIYLLLNIEDNIEELFKELLNKYNSIGFYRRKEIAARRLEIAKRDYEKALKEYEKYKEDEQE